jgi:hypothetical protein
MGRSKEKSKGRKIAYIFIAALFIRTLYVLAFSWTSQDMSEFIELAGSIRVSSFMLDGVPTTVKPMLLPLIASFFPSVDLFLLAQCILGSLTCGLLYLIARKSRISSWGAWLYVFAPLTIHFTGTIMSETLFTFLTVLAIYLWTAKRWYWAGSVFGLAALAGPTILPLLVFGIVLAIFIKYELKPILIMAAIAIVVALPWMIRNSIVDGRPTLTQRSTLGTDLLLGTFTGEESGVDAVAEARIKYPDNSASARIAAERITSHPLLWVKARIEQYPRLFIDTGDYLTSSSAARIFIVLMQLLIGVMAILGLKGRLLSLWIVPLFLALLYLPLWTESPYFLSAIPFTCLLAGVGFKKLLRIVAKSRLADR